jgi:hypothetical protein
VRQGCIEEKKKKKKKTYSTGGDGRSSIFLETW